MTVYSVLSDSQQRYLAVRAVNFEIKLIHAELYAGYTVTVRFPIHRVPGATLSGGTVYTPNPLRQGAPAAAAQARVGDGVTYTGTAIRIATAVVGANSSGTYEFPFETTLSPGSVVVFDGLAQSDGTNYSKMTLFFEELRLGWSY